MLSNCAWMWQMRKLPRLKALQAFEAGARLSSFTAAGEELHITTSAISHQIRSLESALGVSLFHRNSRRVVLTDAGSRYFQDVTEAFDLIGSATKDIERTARSDILTIHCVPSFAAQWLMPRLSQFSARHKNFDVRLSASVESIDLTTGGVDIDIRYGTVLPAAGVLTVPLPDEAMVVLCSPGLARTKRHPIRKPTDLRHYTLIHSEINLISWRLWAKAHGDVALDFDRGPRFDRSFLAISAAVDGLGVCLESLLLVQRELESGQLTILFGTSSPRITCHSVSVLRAKQNVPKIRAFRDWLFDELSRPLRLA
jgi:LysR family transcriptional regulator, glycine cleavage system transcriptional activator